MSGERRDGADVNRPGPGAGIPVAVLLLASVALAGCAGGFLGGGGTFDRAFEDGRYEAAMAAFARDSSLHGKEEPLFRVGLLRATPDRPYYDPDRARTLLNRLLDRHPGTRFRAYAEGLLSLLNRVEEVSSRVASLRASLAKTGARADSLRTALRESDTRADSLEEELAAAEGLEKKLEAALDRAARLQKQLEQLKQVHLRQPPDSGASRFRD